MSSIAKPGTSVVGRSTTSSPWIRPKSSRFRTAEIAGNTYERLISYDLKDVSKIYGELAESWTVSRRRQDLSRSRSARARNSPPATRSPPRTSPIRSQRAVMLDKTPAFILGQFGLTKDNVKDKVKADRPTTNSPSSVDKAYAPTFVLNCLTATVASVVDKKLRRWQQREGRRLRQRLAEDQLCRLRRLQAPRLEGQRGRRPGAQSELFRARRRRSPASSIATSRRPRRQRLLLEKGDIDVARNLEPGRARRRRQERGHQDPAARRRARSIISA